MAFNTPDGVFSFFMADSAAEKLGLKTGRAIVDLVNRKSFNTTSVLQEIKAYGFMCPFEPCEKYLRQCGLEEFVVVCDPTSKYGEMFVLLYTMGAILSLKSDAELRHAAEARANEEAERESEAAAAVEAQLQKAVYVHVPMFSRPYTSMTCSETAKEVALLSQPALRPLLSYTVSRPMQLLRRELNLGDRNNDVSGSIDFRRQKMPEFDLVRAERDTAIQAAPSTTAKSTQTKTCKLANKITQYEQISLNDCHENPETTWKEIGTFLRKNVSKVEEALQENTTIDTFADSFKEQASDQHDKDGMQNGHGLKEYWIFTDLEYSKGKSISCIDWHPTNHMILAMSVCTSSKFNERMMIAGRTNSAHIIVWHFDSQLHPMKVLTAPHDCPTFRFNPTMPHIVVAGCINGQIVLWDLTKGQSTFPNESSLPQGHTAEFVTKGLNQKVRCMPIAISNPEFSHQKMVADLCWLPPGVQVNARGRLLSKERLTDESHQFITVSGDGYILFWDTRYKEIMAGKLTNIAKPKSTKHNQTYFQQKGSVAENDFPCTKWSPLFRIKCKRLEGSGELSFCKALLPYTQVGSDEFGHGKKSEIICSSEEGNLFCINWAPTDQEEVEEGGQYGSDVTIPEYVQWMKTDHTRPCVALSQSPFFPSYILTVSDRNFHIRKIDKASDRPVFSSRCTAVHLTTGTWSPTRPGVVFLARVDGSVDVWDFLDTCYHPSRTLTVTPSRITSLEVLNRASCHDQQMVAVGDSSGSLHILEVTQSLANIQAKEMETVHAFFARELNRGGFGDDSGASDIANEIRSKTAPSTKSSTGCKKEELHDPQRNKNPGTDGDSSASTLDAVSLTESEEAAYMELKQTLKLQLGLEQMQASSTDSDHNT